MNELILNRLRGRHHGGTLFSVIIPAHNAEKTLRRAVESVFSAMETVGQDAVVRARLQGDGMKQEPAGGEKMQAQQAAQQAGAEGNPPQQAESGENPPPQTGPEGNPPQEDAPGMEPTAETAAALFEVLVIENTSEDGTWELATTLQEEHPGKVRAFQCDPGVSNGRNRGLEEACGEWVLFLDADDYFIDGAGAVLRDAVHFTGTDLILCSFEAGEKTVHVCPEGGERFSGKELMEISVRIIEDPTRYTSVWGKFFRRACIERLHLRFDPGLRLSEDSHFLIRYLSACRRIRLIDRPFYHYSTDNMSVVRNYDGTKEEGYCKALAAVQDFLRTQPGELRRAGAAYGMMQFNILMVREVFSTGNPMSLREKIRRMKEISEEEPFAAAIRTFDPKRHKGVRFLPVRLLRRGLLAGAAAIYEARVLQNGRKEKRDRSSCT